MARALFLPAARRDVIETSDWYTARFAGLSAQFIAEIDRQVLRIASALTQFQMVSADIRRALLRRSTHSGNDQQLSFGAKWNVNRHRLVLFGNDRFSHSAPPIA